MDYWIRPGFGTSDRSGREADPPFS